ncbi:nucleoside phosphorylase [Thermococcus sp.]
MIPLLRHNYHEKISIEKIRQDIYEAAKRNGVILNEEHFHGIVILALNVPMLHRLLQMTNAREVPWIYRMRPLYEGYIGNTPVNIIWAAPGAPLAAYVMEHLIAIGGKIFIGVGTAGNVALDGMHIVIPTGAIRDEGTSYHYIPPSEEVSASKEVVSALLMSAKELNIPVKTGLVWSTDAPLRETPSMIETYKKRGVLAVDMETSAIFAVAQHRGVKAGCILLSGHEVQHPLPFDLREATIKIALNSVKYLQKSP